MTLVETGGQVDRDKSNARKPGTSFAHGIGFSRGAEEASTACDLTTIHRRVSLMALMR